MFRCSNLVDYTECDNNIYKLTQNLIRHFFITIKTDEDSGIAITNNAYDHEILIDSDDELSQYHQYHNSKVKNFHDYDYILSNSKEDLPIELYMSDDEFDVNLKLPINEPLSLPSPSPSPAPPTLMLTPLNKSNITGYFPQNTLIYSANNKNYSYNSNIGDDHILNYYSLKTNTYGIFNKDYAYMYSKKFN